MIGKRAVIHYEDATASALHGSALEFMQKAVRLAEDGDITEAEFQAELALTELGNLRRRLGQPEARR